VVAFESLFPGLTGWLTRRLAGAGLAALAAAALYGGWLYLRQEALQEWERRGRLETARADLEKLGRAREALARRTTALESEAAAQELRRRQAENVIAELGATGGWWGRWFGDREKTRSARAGSAGPRPCGTRRSRA
jgi:cell division protein FtsB